MSISRHDLVWLTTEGWDCLYDQSPEKKEELTFWQEHNYPTIVRRCELPISHERIAVGMALPPSMGKQRLAFSVGSKHINNISKPLSLTKIIPYAPKSWQENLITLAQENLEIGVYGSLSWQVLTQLDYVQLHSDIDLLFKIDTHSQLTKALTVLKHFSLSLPLDGELIFPDGSAVSWKEMRDQQPSLLVKRLNSVNLVKREVLLKDLVA